MSDKEKGFTTLPNIVIDSMKLDPYQFQIFTIIVRKTDGWCKVEDGISLSQFEKLVTFSKNKIISTIKELIDLLLIEKVKQYDSINKRYSYSLYKISKGVVHEVNKGSASHEQGVVHEVNIQKKTNTKETNTSNKTSNKKENDLNYSFEDFWVLVPKGHKKKPELARKHFEKHSSKPLFPKSLQDLKDSLIPFSAMCEFKYKYLPNITTWINDGCYAEDFCIDDLSEKLSTRFTDPRARREFKKKVENFINSQIEELSDAKNSEYTDVA